MRPPKILFVLNFLLALTVWGRDVEIRETVLDIASPSELSGTRFVPDAGTLCATQIRGVVRLGGAYRPGAKPFRGVASVVIDMPSLPSAVTQGVVQLNLHHRDSGARKSFRAPWMGRTVVKTDLDPKAWYQTDDIYFNPEKRAEPIPKVSVVGVTGLRMGAPAEAFSLDVETGSALHVTDDPAYVCVLLRNRSVRTLSVTGTVTATHYFRTRVHTPFAGTVAAAGALRLPLGDLLRGVPASRGLWRVTAEVFSEGSRAVPDETRFAVLNAHAVTSRLPPERFRLGVNVHYPKTDSSEYPRYLEALQTVGCKLTRGGPFAFNRCWPKAEMPEPDFSEPDRLMADLKRLGISVNAGCWPNPAWSSPVAEEGYRKVIHTRPIRGLMGRYCEKLARHFGADIDYIETANEPDWWNADEFPAADYVDYQKEGPLGTDPGGDLIFVVFNGFL